MYFVALEWCIAQDRLHYFY